MRPTWYRRRPVRRISIQRRRLLAESLEQRYLLAGDALQNPDNPNDVNNDTRVSAIDALIIVNSMTRDANAASSGEGETAGTSSTQYYLDTSGDGSVTAKDALRVINALAEGEELELRTVNEDEILTIPTADLLGDTTGASITAVNGFSVDSDLFLTRRGGSLSISVDPTGSFLYTPPTNFNGNDSFTYSLTTPTGADELTVPISVSPVNDPPSISGPASLSTNEDTPLSLAGFRIADVDSSSVTVTLSVGTGRLSQTSFSGAPAEVSNTLSGITYTPLADANGLDTLTIDASDNNGDPLSDIDTVNITINPINDPPLIVVPQSQQFFTDFDNRLSVSPQISDAESAQIELNLSLSSGMLQAPSEVGQVIVEGSGTNSLTYNGFIDDLISAVEATVFLFSSPGDQTLTFTVNDLEATDPRSATATTNLSVTPENFLQKPSTATIGVNSSVTFGDIAIKPIPGIPDPIRLAISAFNPQLQTFFGSSTLGSTDGLTFLDGDGTNDQNMFFEGTRAAINNALQGLTISVGNQIVAGQDITQLESNTLQFVISTPDETFVRFGAILIDAVDSSTLFAANDDFATTAEDTPSSIDVLQNDFKLVPSLTVTVTQVNSQDVSGGQTVTLPSGGQVSSDGTGLAYTPPDDFFGTDTFTFTISDDAIEPVTDSAIITIVVTPINDDPIAIDDSFDLTLSLSEPRTIDVLANDDPGGGSLENSTDTVTITSFTDPAKGTATIDNRGTGDPSDDLFRYEPDFDFDDGTDTFTYTITDSGGLTDTATVTINLVPVVRPRFLDVNEDSPITPIDIPPQLIGGGLVDINGTPISEGGTVKVGGGTVSLSEGVFGYQPDLDFNGIDTFTYTITDDSALITVDVTPVNDPPTANPDTATTPQNSALTIPFENLFFNDDAGPANESDQTLRITSLSGGNPGSTVRFNANGSFTYTPPLDFEGTDTFTYTITDDGFTGDVIDPQFAFSTITIDVTDDIVAIDDGPFTFNEDSGPQTIDVLANDSVFDPPDTDPMITQVNGDDVGVGETVTTGNGSTVANNGSNLTFTSADDFFGSETFTYTITNGQDALDSATVNIEITPINDGPINTIPGSQEIDEDNDLVFSGGAFSVSDADGDVEVQVNLRSLSGLGTINVPSVPGVTQTDPGTGNVSLGGTVQSINDALNSLTYSPNLNVNGTDSLQISTNDLGNVGGGALSDTDTVNITIAPINDGPINTVPGPQVLFNTDTLQFSDGDFSVDDVDSSTLEVTLEVDPDNGAKLRLDPQPGDIEVTGNDTSTLKLIGSRTGINLGLGDLVYDPFDDFAGTDILLINTSDGSLFDEDTVSITVTPPRVPFAAADLFIISEDSPATELPVKDNDLVPDPNAQPPNRLTITSLNGEGLSGSISISTDRGGTLRYDADTDSFIYTPAPDDFGLDTFTYTVESSPNPGQGESEPATVEINITPVNDAPVLVVPGPQSFLTDFDNTFSNTNQNSLQIRDVDAGDDDVQVDLTIGDGALTISDTSNLNSVSGNGTNSLSIRGSVSDINASLGGGLTFNTPAGGNKTLSATVNDLGNFGSGGPLSDTGTVDIEVLDFVPVDLIGRVFIEVAGSDDPGVAGVDVILSGVDFQGNSVNSSQTTDSTGRFSFLKLRPNGAVPYTVTQQAPTFIQGGKSNQQTIDLRQRSEPLEVLFPVFISEFKPEFIPVFDLFGRTQNASGIDIGIFESRQLFSMFVGDGWGRDRFSNVRLDLSSDRLSALLSVFDAQAGADRTANVSVGNGTLTYRGNGADRVYRVIGGSELLGLIDDAVDQVMLIDL